MPAGAGRGRSALTCPCVPSSSGNRDAVARSCLLSLGDAGDDAWGSRGGLGGWGGRVQEGGEVRGGEKQREREDQVGTWEEEVKWSPRKRGVAGARPRVVPKLSTTFNESLASPA